MTAPARTANQKAGRPTWLRPDDLRERMLAATRSGTNLDPSPSPAARKQAPQTVDERREKARVWARENRARQKAERLARDPA